MIELKSKKNYYQLAVSYAKSEEFLFQVKAMLKDLKIYKDNYPSVQIGFKYYYDIDSNKIIMHYFHDYKHRNHSVLEEGENYNTHKLFFKVIYGSYSQSKLAKMITAINSNESNNSFDEDNLADALIKQVKRDIVAIEKKVVQHETNNNEKRYLISLALSGRVPFADIHQQIPVFEKGKNSVLEDIDYDFSFISLQEGTGLSGKPSFLWNKENLKIILSHRQLVRSIINSGFFRLKGEVSEELRIMPSWLIDLFSFLIKELDGHERWKLARFILALVAENNNILFDQYDDYRAEFLDQYLEKEELSENEKNYKLFFSMFDELNNNTNLFKGH